MADLGVLRLYDIDGRARVTYPYFGGMVTIKDMPAFLMERMTITRADGVEREIRWDYLGADRKVLAGKLAIDFPGGLHLSSLR